MKYFYVQFDIMNSFLNFGVTNRLIDPQKKFYYSSWTISIFFGEHSYS